MNKNQKLVLISGILIIVIAVIVWIFQGAEIFTKTQILIDKTTDLDRMLGVENKEFVDQFVFGLLPSGFSSIIEILSLTTVSGMIAIISGVLLFILKNKRRETK